LGHYSATALGDFIAGPSHVLPTGRSSRFSSGLRIQDFLRRSSFIHYDQAALVIAEPEIASFAEMENLDAHGRSVNLRALPSD
jgi:histidinol dehydrogenase